MEKIKNIFIVCGEPSGDINAANLAKAMLRLDPRVRISGIAGEVSREAGVYIYRDIKELSVMGLSDVLKKLPLFLSLQKFILDKISFSKPDAIILVDFSGFNLRLAKKINKNIPVIYYVSPQVWASRAGRLKTIKKYVDKVVVLYKFEEEFYKKHGIDAEFAGHPLLDIVRPSMGKEEFLRRSGIPPADKIIALLPGSRKQEIKHILPLMLEAAAIMDRKIKGLGFIIAKPPQVNMDIYNRLVNKSGINLKVIEGQTYDCLNAADFCLVASGTATLETAIMQKPFALIYKMNLLNYLIYRPQVKIPYICMANIIAGKGVVPEFIQFGACPYRIAVESMKIMTDPAKLKTMKEGLASVKSLLGEDGASKRAARIILDYLKNKDAF
ncbi:MAG: lipid-A-disaccharide synthase [Candidatus Omnitrophota bacterium]|jgi:lipid-A-disaccharide synthase